jgi:hypothetical protein
MIRSANTTLVLIMFALGAWAQGSTPGQTSPPKLQKVKELPSKHSGLPAIGEFEGNQTESPTPRPANTANSGKNSTGTFYLILSATLRR